MLHIRYSVSKPAHARAPARFVIFILAVLVARCASTPNVERNYVLSEARGMGLVIGTITSSGHYADYQLRYRGIGRGPSGYFHLKSLDPSLNGALIVAELPAGDYEIYNWRIARPITPFEYLKSETEAGTPFSIPFHVTPGQAAYIGNCAFDARSRAVTCRDRVDRDFMEFEAFYPALRKTVTSPASDKGQFYESGRYEIHLRRREGAWW